MHIQVSYGLLALKELLMPLYPFVAGDKWKNSIQWDKNYMCGYCVLGKKKFLTLQRL